MHRKQFDHQLSTFYPSYSDHACFDHLSSETYAKYNVGAKAFGTLIVVARTPNLFLLLAVITIIIISFITVFAGVLFVHQPGANHAPRASVTQVNHKYYYYYLNYYYYYYYC